MSNHRLIRKDSIILIAVIPTLVTMVFSQTAAEGGNAAADTLTSGANETIATATATDGDNNMTEAKFSFIQGAQSGSVSEVNATTSTLELNDVSDKTILFSDRPDRIVASANTTDFIGNWSIGENNFAVDPPNAVLILDDLEERQEFAVIELFNPEYDPEANTLKYDIIAENATTTTSINLPGEFGQSTLVIDDDEDHHEGVIETDEVHDWVQS